MAKFVLAIECDSRAFAIANPNGIYTEVTCVLAGLIRHIAGRPVPEKDTEQGDLFDSDGDIVGSWLFRP